MNDRPDRRGHQGIRPEDERAARRGGLALALARRRQGWSDDHIRREVPACFLRLCPALGTDRARELVEAIGQGVEEAMSFPRLWMDWEREPAR